MSAGWPASGYGLLFLGITTALTGAVAVWIRYMENL